MTATLRAQPTAEQTESRARHDELHGMYLEDLAVGMTAVYAKTITDAAISGTKACAASARPGKSDAK